MKKGQKINLGIIGVIAVALLAVLWTSAFAVNVTINGPGTSVQNFDLDQSQNKGLTVDGSTGDIAVDVTSGNYAGAVNGSAPTGTMIYLQDKNLPSGVARYTTVSVSGTYSFRNLPDGDYLVYPVSDGFQFTPPFAVATISSANTVTQNFTASLEISVCPVYGACGSSEGQTFSTAPSSGLCNAGAPSSVSTTSGGYSWSCGGTDGGAASNCSARAASTNGACGTSSGKIYKVAPTTALCSIGTADSTPSGNGPWSWKCSGANGGTQASCSANQTACGSATNATYPTAPTANLCSYGTASVAAGGSATSPWTWTCTGNDSSAVTCNAPYGNPTPINGACGSSNGQQLTSAPTTNLCTAGTASGVSGTNPWTWTCAGINGGTTANCATSGPTGSFTPLTFNAGTQSKQDTLTPGQTRYYTFTVPAGNNGFSMNISLITQVANLDMVVTQSTSAPTTGNMDLYVRDAVAYYNANPSLWSTPYIKKYPPSVWAKMGTDFGGEGIYLKTSTRVPAIDSAGFAASIPGTYYVAVKNESTTASATYYVYAKQ